MTSELLERIHYYYPIGMPGRYSDYPGFIKLRSIIEEKIIAIQNNEPTPFTRLMERIREKYNNLSLNDLSYHQFPSYLFTIELGSSQQQQVEISNRIIVAISLLGNFYTIYVENLYHFSGFKTNKTKIAHHILYNDECNDDETITLIKGLKDLILSSFKDYKYVDHYILFNTYLRGEPTLFNMKSYDPFSNHSFYEFLFSTDKCYLNNLFVLDKLTVLK